MRQISDNEAQIAAMKLNDAFTLLVAQFLAEHHGGEQ